MLLTSPLSSPLSNPLQHPFALGVSGGAASPFAAFNATVQALYTSNATTGVWYDGTDSQYLTVNSDGSGGAPATGASFGRFIDRTGGGNHCVQATAASQPYRAASEPCVFFPNKDFPSGGSMHFALSTSAPGGASGTQSCSGVMIVDTQSLPFDALPAAGVAIVTKNNTPYPCAKSFMAWRLTPTKQEVYVNGVAYSIASPVASGVLRQIRLGTNNSGTGAFGQHESSAFYQYVLYNVALNDADFLTLRTAAMAASGASTLSTDTIIIHADSIGQGVGSAGNSYPRQLARATNATVYNYGRAGQGWALQQSDLTTEIDRTKGAGKNTVIFAMGVNDGGQLASGNDVEIIQRAEARYAESRGYATIVLPTIYPSGSALAFVNAFNAAFAANHYQYADGYVDLTAVPGWEIPDGIHYNDADNTRWLNAVLPEYQRVTQAPLVRFTRSAPSGVAPLSASFTDTSANAPTSWAWTLTGGSPSSSTSQNPSAVNYASVGEYSVQLSASNAFGSGLRILPYAEAVQSSLAPSAIGRVGWFKRNTSISVSSWVNQDSALPFVLTAEGSGYTDGTYAIVFSGGGGSGAAGTYTCANGRVVSVARTADGSGYATAPTLAFTNGGGSGAAGTAFISGGILVNAPTFDYSQATGGNQPTVTGNGTWLFNGSTAYAFTGAVTTLAANYSIMARIRLVTQANLKTIFDGAGANNKLETTSITGRLQHNSSGGRCICDGVTLNQWMTWYFGMLPEVASTQRSQALQFDDGPLMTNSFYNGTAAPTALYLGANSAGGSQSNIEVAELIITTGPITDRVRAQNRAYLKSVI